MSGTARPAPRARSSGSTTPPAPPSRWPGSPGTAGRTGADTSGTTTPTGWPSSSAPACSSWSGTRRSRPAPPPTSMTSGCRGSAGRPTTYGAARRCSTSAPTARPSPWPRDAFFDEAQGELGGTWTPDAGYVDDASLAAHNLAAAARAHGATYLLRREVTALEPGGPRRWRVHVRHGDTSETVDCDVVVNAAGPWSGAVNALAARGRGLRGDVATTAPGGAPAAGAERGVAGARAGRRGPGGLPPPDSRWCPGRGDGARVRPVGVAGPARGCRPARHHGDLRGADAARRPQGARPDRPPPAHRDRRGLRRLDRLDPDLRPYGAPGLLRRDGYERQPVQERPGGRAADGGPDRRGRGRARPRPRPTRLDGSRGPGSGSSWRRTRGCAGSTRTLPPASWAEPRR